MTRYAFEFGRWQDAPWEGVTVIAALVALSLVILSIYRQDVRRQSRWVRRALLLLRLSILAAVGLVLLEP